MMGPVESRVRDLNDLRMRKVDEARAVLQRPIDGKRDLSGEEQRQYDSLLAEHDALTRERDDLIASELGQRELEEVNEAYRQASTPARRGTNDSDEAKMISFLEGRTPNLTIDLRPAAYVSQNYRDGARGVEMFERRGLYTDAGGGSLTIPSLVSSTIYATMLGRNVMRQTGMSLLTTPNGNPLAIPTGSEGAATQIATENTAIGGTDPTLSSKVLAAWRFGEIVQVSNTLARDSSVNVLDFVAENIGRSIATKEEAWWVAGDGSSKPLGITKSGGVGSGGTVATGGSLLLGPSGQVLEKWIDFQYSVNSSYRSAGEWLVHDTTAASLRKLRDGSGGTIGAFCWEPSPTAGMINGTPDTFLGRPIHTSTSVDAAGSAAIVGIYGDFSYFVARQVNGLRLERSTDFAFDKDQIALRGIAEIDSDIADTTAINRLHMAVS